MMPAQVTLSLDVQVKYMSTAASDLLIATPRRGEIFGTKMSNRLYDAVGIEIIATPMTQFSKTYADEDPPTL